MVPVLAALCCSPRRELRRLSVKALAALTWNGHTESRKLGSDMQEQWRLWVDVVVGRREQMKSNIGQSLARDGAGWACRLSSSSIPISQCLRSPRWVTVARRQWALRHRRILEEPNHANMHHAVRNRTSEGYFGLELARVLPQENSTPFIRTLLLFSHDRDQDCVLSAVKGLASVSFNADNASFLGLKHGLISSLVNLVQHPRTEIVSLACDVRTELNTLLIIELFIVLCFLRRQPI